MSDLRLGSLVLTAPIGRGGMGTVWRGWWTPLAMSVAVKVIHSTNPRILSTFDNEIRAAAALDHPNIVTVYHHGRIPVSTAEASGGRLQAGALYFVMELVEGGSLRSRCGQLHWSAIRTVLLSLLSALAHAHARGVVHRDIKPGNILVGPQRTIGRVRLTDFGLARDLRETDADAQSSMGTPRYMAPEQSKRRWRDLGPWTDLYALGRVAQALICGESPSSSESTELWTPLPAALSAWMSRMLAPETRDRFQCAADAAFALTRLDMPAMPSTQPTRQPPIFILETLQLDDESQTWSDVSPPSNPTSPARMCPRSAPPFPIDWRPGEPLVRPLPVLGLSLFGLRTPPLIGREDERDALWQLLQRSADGERQLVAVKGGTGCGKSRLIHWLIERAESTGAANGLTIQHTERGGRALERALARRLRVSGLPRETISLQVEIHLRQHGVDSDYERNALTEILAPIGAVQFNSAGERYAVILRTLRRLSAQRPLILWLEDAQWGLDALGLVQHTLAARQGLPILIVLTWTEMPDRPLEAAQLAAFQPHATLNLPPLAADDTHTLTQDILRLSPYLAARLAVHSDGNPMFAIQIAADWVERGLLTVSSEGFTTSPVPQLPATLRELWGYRVRALLADLSEGDVRTLELAAVLGAPVDMVDWSDACRAEGITLSPALATMLLDRGLARQRRGEGWTFIHWLFREALEQHALAHGRLQQHHRACADVLTDHHAPGNALRVAHHMLAAGDDAATLAPLLTAASRYAQTGDLRQGDEILATRRAALDRLDHPPDHPERLEGSLLASYFAQMTGKLSQAVVLAEQTARHANGVLHTKALLQLARLRREQGRLDDSAALIATAQSSCSSPIQLAHCHRDRAAVDMMRGDLEAAEAGYTTALAGYLQCRAQSDLAKVHKGLGRLKLKQGDFQQALHHIEASRELQSTLGGRLELAGSLNSLGEIHRAQGALDEAERCYRAALDNLRDTALSAEVLTEVNLALVLIERGQYCSAEQIFQEAIAYFSRSGQHWMQALLMAYRLPGLVEADRLAEVPGCIEHARRLAEETGVRDGDAAALAQQAADACQAVGRADLVADLAPLIALHR